MAVTTVTFRRFWSGCYALLTNWSKWHSTTTAKKPERSSSRSVSSYPQILSGIPTYQLITETSPSPHQNWRSQLGRSRQRRELGGNDIHYNMHGDRGYEGGLVSEWSCGGISEHPPIDLTTLGWRVARRSGRSTSCERRQRRMGSRWVHVITSSGRDLRLNPQNRCVNSSIFLNFPPLVTPQNLSHHPNMRPVSWCILRFPLDAEWQPSLSFLPFLSFWTNLHPHSEAAQAMTNGAFKTTSASSYPRPPSTADVTTTSNTP